MLPCLWYCGRGGHEASSSYSLGSWVSMQLPSIHPFSARLYFQLLWLRFTTGLSDLLNVFTKRLLVDSDDEFQFDDKILVSQYGLPPAMVLLAEWLWPTLEMVQLVSLADKTRISMWHNLKTSVHNIQSVLKVNARCFCAVFQCVSVREVRWDEKGSVWLLSNIHWSEGWLNFLTWDKIGWGKIW